MQRFWRSTGMALAILFMSPVLLWAQEPVSAFRYIVTQDVDFYGSDLDALFDTDIDSCIRACSAQDRCAAFTFNTRSNACFPKTDVSRKTSYDGAVSATKVAVEGAVLQRAKTRVGQLDFLQKSDLEAAEIMSRDLGFRHRAGGLDASTALDAAQARLASGNVAQALGWTGIGLSLTDRADLWTEYARLSLLVAANDTSNASRYTQRAVSAAINGFLRSDTAMAQGNALLVLSQALERSGRGRDTIPALQLAQSIDNAEQIDVALQSSIARFGFRITNTTVDNDAAAPRICAEFSAPLIQAGYDYDSYVRLPQSAFAVQAEGSQLCIDGVAHGNRYSFTFRAGLPAADGQALSKDVEITQYVRDRSPSLRFPGRAYVLPKTADAALPIETVNLSNVELKLRKVSDRNLLRAIQDDYFGRPLSQWQDANFASDIAEDVWSGTAETGNQLNEDMTTRLPLAEVIAGQPAGIYALSARVPGADPYDNPGATQWFVLSDLGIGTLSGTDGLQVNIRDLSTAGPRADVTVTLVSRANAVLARAVTDQQGKVQFESGLTRGTGGAAPALVMAEDGETDISFLSLTDPAFDLSDRGVEGRPPAGPVDVFLTADRGAYRAGETIHATVLARDPSVYAINNLPLIAVLRRPDGVEYARRVSEGGNAGGHVFGLHIGESAPRGTWRLDIKSDPKSPALASQSVLVEDFLPERIDFDLSLPETALNVGDSPILQVDARYLFGAPGADLTIEGQATLRAANNIVRWPGFHFGRHDDRVDPVSSYFGKQRTDAQGLAAFPLDLPQAPATDRPLELTVTARLADGSTRPVERQIRAPVQPDMPMIGIKPLFEGVVAEGAEAAFELIALSPDFDPLPMRVKWSLNRVETQYQWYQLYGSWNWEPTTRRTRIASGETEVDGPVPVSSPVEWGEYELVVEQVDGGYAAASVAFSSGWFAAADASATPDRLELSLDSQTYRVGDSAMLRIVSRVAGAALITVMSDKIIHEASIEVEAGETVVPLAVNQDWGTGAYVSATVIRPMDVKAGRNPARSIGLAYAKVEPVGQQLNVAIRVPDVARPRQSQPVDVTVTGAQDGDEVWLTLAAVDLGILNLTAFQSPDPTHYYFGQRRLGVELRDVYGRLIDGLNGAVGTLRSGGDAGMAMRMQSPPPTQDLMAAFSGPVRVGPDGKATVNLDLPSFNGTVRIMAVAWSRRAVGQGEADMQVRDPVVVTASLPNFLAPGDSSRVRLDVVNTDAPDGLLKVRLVPDGAALTFGPQPEQFELAPGAKAVFEVPVTAQNVGDPEFDIILTMPDGRELRQTLTLPVRMNDPVVASTRRFALGGGDTFDFTSDVFADMQPGTGSAIISAGALARFDVPGILGTLERYPYGCSEQVTSKALPLLYLSGIAGEIGLGDQKAIRARVDAAIAQLMTRQSSNGAFGLWQAGSGDFWLDSYITDFLSRARAERFEVPDRAFRLAMDNLRNRINYAPDFDSGGEDIAFALMVLAREGAASMGDLRYYADVKSTAFATPLAAAQLGAALAYYGDQPRADAMFARAARMLAVVDDGALIWRADYGTALRDTAGVLALATRAGSDVVDPSALGALLVDDGAPLSTQESAWSLLAAHALVETPENSGLLVDGAPASSPFVKVLDSQTQSSGLAISTVSHRSEDLTLTTFGVPSSPPPAGGTGYAIGRSYYNLDGVPIDEQDLSVGDRFVIVLQIDPFEAFSARLIVNDPLPAGIEIDNPALLRSGDVRALDWLQPSEVEHAEFRSDRFLAAVDLRSAGTVTLAYGARAVSPGSFHRPAASVEDMYRPRYRAHTDTGRVDIAE